MLTRIRRSCFKSNILVAGKHNMAQMPPPPGFPGQGFDPIPQFDVGGYDSDDHGGDHGPQRNNSIKKNKGDKDKKKSQVEVQYEGFMLEKAAPDQIGEKPNWSRAGHRPLPFSDAKLAEICRKVRVEYRVGPLYVLTRLSADQQGVINRLVAKRQLDEKNKDAEWVLECVRKYTEKHWRTRTIETVKIMVILKRQDRNATKATTLKGGTKGFQFQQSEIIDLSAPMKDKKKDKNKNKNHDEGPREVPMGGGLQDPFADVGHGPGHGQHHDNPIMNVPPPPPGHHQQPQHHHQGHQPQWPPQGAIPVNQFPEQQQHGPMPHEGNPFQPNPQFNFPGAFDMPPNMDPQRQNHFQTRNMTPNGRRDSRSSSREERRYQQQRDSARLDRRLELLEDRIGDRFDEFINKVEDWNLRDERNSSSDRSFGDRDDVWSAQSGGSFTPPSTPPLSAVMDGPNGTLGRRGSKGYRRDAYYRDSNPNRRSAGQIVLEPYTNRQHGRRRSDFTAPSPPRRSTRPLLHHGHTWNGGGRDDYPHGVYAEPVERERRPRGITQFPGEEYGVAEFNQGRGRRRRDAGRDGGRERYYDERERGGRRGYAY